MKKRRLKRKWIFTFLLILGLLFGGFYLYKEKDKRIVSSSKKPIAVEEKGTNTIPALFIKEDTSIAPIIEVIKEEKYTPISYAKFEEWGNGKTPGNEDMILLVLEGTSQEESLKKEKMKYVLEKKVTSSFVENDAPSEKGKYYWYTIYPSTKKERIKDILDGKKLSTHAEKIAVLNYHFFSTDKTEKDCGETICLKDTQLEEQLKYLKDNEYKSLTMLEYNKWLKKEIELPEKSVLLTTDDGALGTDTVLPELLTKYKQHGTLFLITGFWDIKKYPTGYMEIQDHSYSLHHRDHCNPDGQCGIKTLMLSKEEIKKDLEKSKGIIGNPIAYCYPFYTYDDKTLEVVKELYSLAFIGGNKKSTRDDDPYLIPRYVIVNDITMNDFIEMIS